MGEAFPGPQPALDVGVPGSPSERLGKIHPHETSPPVSCLPEMVTLNSFL